MIALDPEHTTDPDYPVEPRDTRKFSKDDPVWCVWEERGSGEDFYYEPVEPFGRTYYQLLFGDDWDEDDEDDEDDDAVVDSSSLEN